MTTTADAVPFREAQRELGLTASVEKRLLLWLAARLPLCVQPDHLTALGFAATLVAGILYAASAWQPWLVLLVNVALAVYWFGDSLDGTVARHRRQPRPRYGFYIDHLVDSIGAAALLLGLGLSGLMSPLVATAVLVAYLLVSIEMFLATYTLARFRIAHGGIGGTELRIALAALNVAVFVWPGRVLGIGVFDAAGVAAALALAVVFARAAIANGTRLRHEESPTA
jgi:phosphatidylglycerophosphate synthase